MKTSFLIDGFNLYHSIVDVGGNAHQNSAKWLDVPALCQSVLQNIDKRATLHDIYFFTAKRTHANGSSRKRHRKYLSVLRNQGVHVEEGRFKKLDTKCHHCEETFIKYEEKETDVAIASRLVELVHAGESQAIVLVTGDTDLVPAIETAKKMNPSVKLCSLFPYKRSNEELKTKVDQHITIKPKRYFHNLLADPFETQDGKFLYKPDKW